MFQTSTQIKNSG